MKKWAKLADVVGQPLEAFGQIGGNLVFVFPDSFVVICAEFPSYAECASDAEVCEEEPGDVLDAMSEQMVVDLSIATRDEVAALEAERRARRAAADAAAKTEAEHREREQFERLRKKYG